MWSLSLQSLVLNQCFILQTLLPCSDENIFEVDNLLISNFNPYIYMRCHGVAYIYSFAIFDVVYFGTLPVAPPG